MKLRAIVGLLLCSSLLFISSCETDDIEPTIIVSLSTDNVNIFEVGGTATVTATINAEAPADVNVTLFFGGTAQGNGEDYAASANSIIIPQGSLSGSITVTATNDTIQEGNQTIVISISEATNADVSTSDNSVTINIEDDDVAPTAQIIVNEVLYDPPSGNDGDANGDGTRDPQEDEFVEFINTSSQPFDLSGFLIYDSEALTNQMPRHVIPVNTIINPGKALVVFGGGTPTGSFGGATVQTASGGTMNLNNSGDVMTLTDPSGNVIVDFDIEPLSNNPDESYTRNPDITGNFEQHNAVSGVLFSPGTKIDGSPF